jgi:hypothetical protein
MAAQNFVGPWSLLQFRNFFTQTVGLLGLVISPSQGRYLHTGQHKHRINADTDIHALSEIRTHDPSVRASKDYLCLRPLGHCDRLPLDFYEINVSFGGSSVFRPSGLWHHVVFCMFVNCSELHLPFFFRFYPEVERQRVLSRTPFLGDTWFNSGPRYQIGWLKHLVFFYISSKQISTFR